MRDMGQTERDDMNLLLFGIHRAQAKKSANALRRNGHRAGKNEAHGK